ncbi:MAG: hypothetical protein LBI47_02240 [Puniceicoccales bacterium]|jgi:DNA polymerase III epsilon subunit-like protein|nr:hypothetical protein [Puniceicoccales bacterium]
MSIIHVIDFEGNRNLGISEFGAVTMENFEIKDVRMEHCSNFFENYLEYFLSLRRSGILAAHSAQTEDCLLRHHWPSPGNVPRFVEGGTTISWGPWIDTKLVYRQLFKGLISYELQDLIASFNLYSPLSKLAKQYCSFSAMNFHNSLFDALATALLIQSLPRYFSNVSLQILLSLCGPKDA